MKLKKQEGFSRVVYGELAITKFRNLMNQYGFRSNNKKTTKFGKIVKHLLFMFPSLRNNHCQNCHIPKKTTKVSLHEKCPNTGKYGPEKNLYLDTFHAVVWKSKSSRFDMKVMLIYWMIAVHCFQFQNSTLSGFLNGTFLWMKVTLNMKFKEFFNSFY